MSTQVPLVTSKKAHAALKRLSFSNAHRDGSHQTMHRPREGGGRDVLVITMGKNPIPRFTLKKILEQAGVSVDEFVSELR